MLPVENPRAISTLALILGSVGDAPGPDRRVLLSQLCGENPTFLDGWARLAEAAYAGGDPVAAYAYSRVGYHRGLDRLRKSGWGGTGQVHWSEPTNQGFLRSLYLLMLSAAALGEEDEASRCHQFLLDLDPEDGLRVGARPVPNPGELLDQEELP